MLSSLWGTLHGLLFTFLFSLCIFSHLKATLSNPGILPLSRTPLDFSDLHENTDNTAVNTFFIVNMKQFVLIRIFFIKKTEGYTVCTKCEIYRPSDAHHCKVCKRCVRKRHHHCQWINNCVGELNQKYFIQFVFYTGKCVTLSILFLTNYLCFNTITAVLSIYSICFVMYSLIRFEDNSEGSKVGPTRL